MKFFDLKGLSLKKTVKTFSELLVFCLIMFFVLIITGFAAGLISGAQIKVF